MGKISPLTNVTNSATSPHRNKADLTIPNSLNEGKRTFMTDKKRKVLYNKRKELQSILINFNLSDSNG
jgi:hypothetical protein